MHAAAAIAVTEASAVPGSAAFAVTDNYIIFDILILVYIFSFA